jgi:hypothetical protein
MSNSTWNTELSPGVRRMLATVGQQAAFEQGRQQMGLLAGVSVTAKAVERTAEAIGADIEMRQQRELEQALQLTLPIPLGPAQRQVRRLLGGSKGASLTLKSHTPFGTR